jgi:hypothetical protein
MKMTADEFYALRDHRTNLCVTTPDYQRASCVVRASNATRFTTQLTLLVACNLLSRWSRTVWIDIPPVYCHPEIGAPNVLLHDRLIAEMRGADPFGNFQILTERRPDALELLIGPGTQNSGRAVMIDAVGWLASNGIRLSEMSFNDEDLNPFGAITAACIGVAEVFRRATDTEVPDVRPFIFDTFGLQFVEQSRAAGRSFPPSQQLGKILMIGAGAVGSSAMFCLKYTGMIARVTCVDFDNVKTINLNRSPMLMFGDVAQKKVEALQRSLSSSRIAIEPFVGQWSEFVASKGRGHLKYDLWLPLANEHGVRWSIANNFPPLLIHASTGTSWAVNFGRHIPLRGECLADRFPDSANHSAFQCATGRIVTPQGTIDAALPFLSCFAGMLIAADIVRSRVQGYPHPPNFAQCGFRRGFQADAFDRAARRGCVCTTAPKDLWKELIADSTHSVLSE